MGWRQSVVCCFSLKLTRDNTLQPFQDSTSRQSCGLLSPTDRMWGQSQEDQNARDWGLYQEGSRLLGKMQGYVQGHTPLETDRTCHLDYSDQGFMKGNATNPLMSTICEGQGTSGCTIQIKKKGSVSWCYDPPGGFTQHFGSFWCYWLPNLKWRFTWRMEFPKFIFMGEFLFFCRSYTLHPSRNMNMLCACESKILEEIFMYDGVSRWNQGSRFEWLELPKVCIQIQSS